MEFMELWAIILNWLYCLFFSSQNIANANTDMVANADTVSPDKYEIGRAHV